MTVTIIPTRTDLENYEFQIELTGEIFELGLRYSYRDDFWYASFRDVNGNPIRSGIRCVVNWPLIRTWIQQGRPEGSLWVINPTEDTEPGRETFGIAAPLVYREVDE